MLPEKPMRYTLPVVLVIALGCSLNGMPVHIVVPNDFKGEVRIVQDKSQGLDVVPTAGRYVYSISADGVLYVKSLQPFGPMHKETAGYEDGTSLPSEHETWIGPNGEPANLGKDAIVLSGGGESSGMNKPPTITFFVGSTIEYEEWQGKQAEAIMRRQADKH